ncbi:MAG TPA: serine hydrolase domain-containing protein, partial [Herpetosiphonaceae bacterium]
MTKRARGARAALTLALGWLLAFGPAARLASARADLAAIDAYLARQMEELRMPGLALGIVRGDEIIALKGYGVAGPDGTPVTPQTAFSIGSLTKSFTALAIMQQVEAGKLELDEPARRYLPWFRVADPAASASITVRHLLNNASGLPRDFDPLAPHAVDQTPETLEARLRSLGDAELEGPV